MLHVSSSYSTGVGRRRACCCGRSIRLRSIQTCYTRLRKLFAESMRFLDQLTLPIKPPKPAYTDPAELVNRSKAKAQPGPVETWSVSEVDKKGKKKKGTLGVGNGAMFFASESDKVSLFPRSLCSSASNKRPRLPCRSGRHRTSKRRVWRNQSTFMSISAVPPPSAFTSM